MTRDRNPGGECPGRECTHRDTKLNDLRENRSLEHHQSNQGKTAASWTHNLCYAPMPKCLQPWHSPRLKPSPSIRMDVSYKEGPRSLFIAYAPMNTLPNHRIIFYEQLVHEIWDSKLHQMNLRNFMAWKSSFSDLLSVHLTKFWTWCELVNLDQRIAYSHKQKQQIEVFSHRPRTQSLWLRSADLR